MKLKIGNKYKNGRGRIVKIFSQDEDKICFIGDDGWFYAESGYPLSSLDKRRYLVEDLGSSTLTEADLKEIDNKTLVYRISGRLERNLAVEKKDIIALVDSLEMACECLNSINDLITEVSKGLRERQ